MEWATLDLGAVRMNASTTNQREPTWSAAWHRARFTNGPTEVLDNLDDLVKRVERVALGITNWTNYRTRALLYAGRPDWSLLAIIPRWRLRTWPVCSAHQFVKRNDGARPKSCQIVRA